MQDCNVDPGGIRIMEEKGDFYILKTSPLPAAGCNILKQQMLSVGGEVAISRGAANCSIETAPAIIFGTGKQYQQLIKSLRYQCFGLKELRQELATFFGRKDNRLKIGDRTYDLTQKTLLMGILNLTPDSFSDGGKYSTPDAAVNNALKMIDDGADILDIGGESTRPGAETVDLETELKRVVPVIERLRKVTDIPISIDTYKSKVARRALEAGADIVNDISGLNFDDKMAELIAEKRATAVLMHIQGTPKSMQKNPFYKNMMQEIFDYLMTATDKLLEKGLESSQIVLDPGIGFGKEWKKNFDILRYLSELKSPGFPVLVGPSRKSFIGNLLNLPVNERLEGTLASVACSIMNGADIIRAHDVAENFRAIKVADKIVGKE